jgi:hypothetical protein
MLLLMVIPRFTSQSKSSLVAGLRKTARSIVISQRLKHHDAQPEALTGIFSANSSGSHRRLRTKSPCGEAETSSGEGRLSPRKKGKREGGRPRQPKVLATSTVKDVKDLVSQLKELQSKEASWHQQN